MLFHNDIPMKNNIRHFGHKWQEIRYLSGLLEYITSVLAYKNRKVTFLSSAHMIIKIYKDRTLDSNM
jgi:hypothetical protein